MIEKLTKNKAGKPRKKKVIQPYDPTVPVKVYMNSNPVCVSPETGVKTAFKLLQAKGFKQILVTDKGKLVGILSLHDILSSLISAYKGAGRIQEQAFSFLSKLYSLSKDGQSKQFNMYEIGKKLGYNATETEYVVETLSRTELLKYEKSFNKVTITPYGIMMAKGEIKVGYAPIL